MKKIFKRIFVIIFSLVFAFSPLFFAGCDTSGIGKNSSTTNQNQSGNSGSNTGNYDDDDIDDIDDDSGLDLPNVKVTDYLGGIKVAYTASSPTDPAQLDFRDEVVKSTQFMASDILLNLFQMYGLNLDDIQPTIVSNDGTITKQLNAFNSPLSMDFGNNENNEFEYNNTTYSFDMDDASYALSIIYGTDGNVNSWNFFNVSDYTVGSREWSNFIRNNTLMVQRFTGLSYNSSTSTLTLSSSAQSNVNKLAYVILLIKQKFENASSDMTDSEFKTLYREFCTEYERVENNTTVDFYKKAQELALTTKYNGVVSGSVEERALKKFILDYVIGTDIVENDNLKFSVFRYGMYESNMYTTNELSGEYVYYNESANYTPDGEPYDISLYIHGDGISNYDQVVGKVQEIYQTTAEHYKFWQDADNDGVIDVEMVEWNGKSVPKYRAERSFRNYTHTVGVIVDKVLTSTENLIQINGNPINYGKSYPTVSNVYSKDYKYSDFEVGSALSDGRSCHLPTQSYKSMILCLNQKEHNNIGEIYMIMESAVNTSVDVSLYARYYRKTVATDGYAVWSDGSTICQLKNDAGSPIKVSVSGNYSLKVGANGKMTDSSFGVDLQQIFASAKFNVGGNLITNSQTFEHNGKSIFEVKLFPKDYYNTAKDTAGHTGIFVSYNKADSTQKDPFIENPLYELMETSDGKKVYSYSSQNLSNCTASEYEFVEILFVASNETPFTFGVLGYVPATEAYQN